VNTAEQTELATTLRLSVQRALLGSVPATLRAVSVAVSDRCIHFRCCFDGPASDDDKELLSQAATEIIADFSEPWTISETLFRWWVAGRQREAALAVRQGLAWACDAGRGNIHRRGAMRCRRSCGIAGVA
jgi:hypothetical protein